MPTNTSTDKCWFNRTSTESLLSDTRLSPAHAVPSQWLGSSVLFSQPFRRGDIPLKHTVWLEAELAVTLWSESSTYSLTLLCSYWNRHNDWRVVVS